ncbi:MAG: aminotransferase class V-fold PLP-dependent enzyme [Deltaproteobacteria bacterium]|nr:MAG: aminotransferase class V-fold PLP-dependent enzyme [Deltaproteobacteria bacterium]
MDPAACRALFPVLEQRLFFNHAGIAPCSTRVIAAMRTVLAEQAGLGSAGYPLWCERTAAVRRQAAAFIGAVAAEIAFVPNTSTGLGLIAESLPWQPGEAVLVATPDFPANVYPWRHLARRGVTVVDVPRRHGAIEAADVARALVPGARLLAVSSVDFATGFAADLPALGAFCREHGLLLAVDAIQSLGLLPLDVKRCGIDALACGAHKWLCGPQGIGLLYLSAELLPRLVPPLVGWKSVVDPEAFGRDFELRGDAAIFEPGTLDITAIAGLGAALELLAEVGAERIRQQVAALCGALIEGLERRGWPVAGPREPAARGGIVAFGEAARSPALFAYLTANGVVAALREGRVRLSPHFANNAAEVGRFFTLLDRYPGSAAA